MTTSARSEMPASGRGTLTLVDTSVAVPLVLVDHQHHAETTEALAGRELGLAGHASFETFSVLTRLPPPNRRTPAAVSELLRTNFPRSRFLATEAAAELLDRLAALAIGGGATYDALVGAVAASHDAVLVTRDRRALDTYRVLDVSCELLG